MILYAHAQIVAKSEEELKILANQLNITANRHEIKSLPPKQSLGMCDSNSNIKGIKILLDHKIFARFEVFTMMIQVVVFWVDM
jgi:hypothetical protein